MENAASLADRQRSGELPAATERHKAAQGQQQKRGGFGDGLPKNRVAICPANNVAVTVDGCSFRVLEALRQALMKIDVTIGIAVPEQGMSVPVSVRTDTEADLLRSVCGIIEFRKSNASGMPIYGA